MFAAGTDTTQTLIEWVIIELIRQPRAMKQVQEEIRKLLEVVITIYVKSILEKLTYLKAVVKESSRLHPPGPLLVFRESSEDVKSNGFDVAAGTQVIINACAIHQDPCFWEEPKEFDPERKTVHVILLDNIFTIFLLEQGEEFARAYHLL